MVMLSKLWRITIVKKLSLNKHFSKKQLSSDLSNWKKVASSGEKGSTSGFYFPSSSPFFPVSCKAINNNQLTIFISLGQKYTTLLSFDNVFRNKGAIICVKKLTDVFEVLRRDEKYVLSFFVELLCLVVRRNVTFCLDFRY